MLVWLEWHRRQEELRPRSRASLSVRLQRDFPRREFDEHLIAHLIIENHGPASARSIDLLIRHIADDFPIEQGIVNRDALPIDCLPAGEKVGLAMNILVSGPMPPW